MRRLVISIDIVQPDQLPALWPVQSSVELSTKNNGTLPEADWTVIISSHLLSQRLEFATVKLVAGKKQTLSGTCDSILIKATTFLSNATTTSSTW